MSQIEKFKEEYPSLESYWRSIILFGRNVASYKFALAKSLLELSTQEHNSITLEELADPFSKHLCEHLRIAPKQITSKSSTFIDACNKYNKQSISKDELITTTEKLGFNNVIDAFHTVNNDKLSISFYEKDYSGKKRIILTDEIYKLKESEYFSNFESETEARWRLVETAWELNISRNLIRVEYDKKDELLFVDSKIRRKKVTSAKDALNGYQKGKCFYCFKDISLDVDDIDACEVDHFFPYVLQGQNTANLNGVWNLVLSCKDCNRGENGKFAKVPSVRYLNRLHKRNEYLINSHHPLRETIMKQTSFSEKMRYHYIKEIDKFAINNLIFRWEANNELEPVF